MHSYFSNGIIGDTMEEHSLLYDNLPPVRHLYREEQRGTERRGDGKKVAWPLMCCTWAHIWRQRQGKP